MPVSVEHQQRLKEKYKQRLIYIQKMGRILEKTINGMSESQACYEEGINLMTFRHLINRATPEHWDIEEEINTVEVTESWKENFLKRILSKNVYVLPDFDQAFEAAVSTLKERDQYILTAYYPQGCTLAEIGEELQLSRERVRNILSQIYHKIQTSEILMDNFRYGCDYAKAKQIERQKKKDEQQAILQKRLQSKKEEMVNRSLSEINLLDDAILSTRSYNLLLQNVGKRNCTLDTLSKLTIRDMQNWNNAGAKSVQEICDVLMNYGVILQW